MFAPRSFTSLSSFLFGRTGGREEKVQISAEEMSRILHLDGRGVRKALGELEKRLLIEPFPDHRILLSFPDEGLKKQFRSRRKVKKTARFSWDRPWENFTEAEIFDHIEDAPNEFVQLWRIMRLQGHYSKIDIGIIREIVFADVVELRTVAKFYHSVERDHRKNQGTGQYQHNSSFNLLWHRLKTEFGKEIDEVRKSCR